MKTKISTEEQLNALTDAQKQSLGKIYKMQLLVLCMLLCLLLLFVGGTVLAVFRAESDVNFAFNTAPIFLIIGSLLVLVLLIGSEIFFKKKYPYYNDKVYKLYKKTLKETAQQ